MNRTRIKYLYPFPETYMRELVNRYKSEYWVIVEDDSAFADVISEGYGLASSQTSPRTIYEGGLD